MGTAAMKDMYKEEHGGLVEGRSYSVNGWTFWAFKDSKKKIDILRQDSIKRDHQYDGIDKILGENLKLKRIDIDYGESLIARSLCIICYKDETLHNVLFQRLEEYIVSLHLSEEHKRTTQIGSVLLVQNTYSMEVVMSACSHLANITIEVLAPDGTSFMHFGTHLDKSKWRYICFLWC